MKTMAGEGKKARNLGLPTLKNPPLRTPTFKAPLFWVWAPSLFLLLLLVLVAAFGATVDPVV